MTVSELALAAVLAAAAAAPAPAPRASTTTFHAALRPGGKAWTFALSGDALAVTPPGAASPSQTLAVHPSDTPPPVPVLETLDLDFDGFKDLRLLIAKAAVGQSVWQYWLFEPKTRRLVPSAQLDATLDARPDTEGRPGLLSAYWNGGARGRVYTRTTYRWVRGKLREVERVEQTEIPGRPDDFRRVVTKNGKPVEEKTVHDPR